MTVLKNTIILDEANKEELTVKKTRYIKICIVLMLMVVLSLAVTIIANNRFRNAQLGKKSYETVEAYVKSVDKIGRSLGMKPATSSVNYRIKLSYNNDLFEIETTDNRFVLQCEDSMKLNLPVTAYLYNGKLYYSMSDTTSEAVSSTYLFMLAVTFILAIALFMMLGAYYDVKKKLKVCS